MRRFFWLLIGYFLLGHVAQATHFAGGDCYYDYVSATPGDNTRARYAIHYIFYRDIQGAQFNATSITVGMYDASPTSVSGVVEVLRTVPQYSRQFLNQYSPGCFYRNPIGYERVEFIDTVDLLRTRGYFFSTSNYARNGQQIQNLNQNGPFSIVLSTYVPPRNSFVNNSPRFRALPVPYACVGKKYVFNHDGFDPDGDSLVFNIVWPYGQGGTYRAGGNVGEGGLPDFNLTTLPLAQRVYFPTRPSLPGNNTGVSGYYTPVAYQGAFSFPSNQVPAIAPDTLKMMGNTGEISFTPTNQGGYVVAIECSEYRVDRVNNTVTYLGSTRRDLQFFFDASCTLNNAPQVFVTDSFTLQVGDTLDFNAVGVDFDPTRDTVIMSISGDIVGAGSGKASVTITPGPSQAVMNIRWIPNCSFARTAPYFLIITAKDSICAVTQKTVFIRVLPKDIIVPPNLRCVSVLGDDSISLSWLRTTSASVDFGKYYIYRNENGGAFSLLDSVSSRNTQSYLDLRVSQADTSRIYGYFMLSVNSCGEPGLTTDTLYSLLPVVQKVSTTQFRVTWNELTTAIGKRYGKIYRLYEDRGSGFVLVQTSTARSYTSSGCNFRIKYKIETSDSQTTCISTGLSRWYNLKDTVRPSTPVITLFSVDGTGKSTITIQKSDSLDAIRYLIYRSSNGGTYSLIDSVSQPGGIGTFVYRDATSNPASIKYCYKVAARDSCGNLSFQSAENCGIKLTGIPGHFSSILSWTPFASPLLTGYVLQRLNGSNWLTIGTFPTTQLGFVDTPRACGVSNTYRVFGTYGPTDSSFSNAVIVIPVDTIKPISPRLMVVSAVANDSNQITFIRSNDPRVKLQRLQVSVNGGVFNNLTAFTSPLTDTLRFWHTGLNNSTSSYCYRVLAFDSCSNNASIPLDTHCVTQLLVTPGSRQNILSWPKYPFLNADSVVVERLDTGWKTWSTLPGSAISFNDTGLICNTSYTYRIKSFSSPFVAISTVRSGTVFDTTRPTTPWINSMSYLNDTMTVFIPTQFDVAGINVYFKTNGGPPSLLRKFFKTNNSSNVRIILPTLSSDVDTFEFYVTSFDSCSGLESEPSPTYFPIHLRGIGGLYTANLSFNSPIIPSRNTIPYSQVVLERFVHPLLGWQAIRPLSPSGSGFNSLIDTVPEYIVNPSNYLDTIDIFCGQAILYRVSYVVNVRTPVTVYSNELEVYPGDTFYPNNVNIIYLSTKGNDSIEVQWKKHIRPTVTKYVVFISQNGGPFVSVDTILNNLPFVYFKRYGRYNMANSQISVRISAYDSCSGKWSRNFETHTHSFLTGTSLPGRKTAVLNWRPYRGYVAGFRYKIIRMDPGNGVSSVIANVLDTFYTDTTMACNNPINYTIFIDEINGDGGSGYTNTITLVGTDTIAPSKPSILSASVRGFNQIEIYPNTNFQDIDSFEVFGKTKFRMWVSLGFYKAQSIITVNLGPTQDSILCIRMVGLDSCANNRSVSSDEHCLMQLTGSPQNLSNQLNWTPYTGINAANKIHLVQEFSSGTWVVLDTLPSTTFQYVHTNLPCGTARVYRITYFDTISQVFSHSDTISLIPFDVTRPDVPEITFATVLDQNTIQLEWTPSTSPDVNRYEIWKSPLGTNNWVLDQVVFYNDSTQVFGSTVDTIWSFRLVAIDSCGNNRSDTSLVHTVANIQGIAQNLQLTLYLSNYRSTRNFSMGLEEYSTVNGWIGVSSFTGLTDTLVINNLPCNQPFTYRLHIMDSLGNSFAYSDSIQLVPFDTITPLQPVVDFLSTNGIDSISLSWSASRSLNVKNYHIYGAPYGTPVAFLDSVPDTVLNYSFLANNTSSPWVIYVLAKNYCNEKLSSFDDSVVTFHPQISQLGCDKAIELDWSLGRFEFPNGNDSITINRGTSANNLSPLLNVSPGTTQFIDTTVQFGMRYYYQIKVNDLNYRNYSLSFISNDSIIPLAKPNVLVTSVVKTDLANGAIEVKWTPIQPIPQSKNVLIYSSTSINGPQTLLGRFARTDSFFVWNGINTETQSYYFHAYLEDSCGFVSESNAPHRDIDFSVSNAQLVNQMNWNHYEGVPVTSYQIEILNGTTWSVFDVVNGNQNAYTRFPAPCNNQITYRLGANLSNGLVSYSDTVTVRVIDNIVPDTAFISQATVLNDSVVQLTFTMAGASDIYGYSIQQSLNGNAATSIQFVPQGTVGTTVTIFDTINTLSNRICYSILTQDSCLNVSKSDDFCVIQLEGLAENLQNTLRWRPFAGYSIQTYEVAEWNGSAWITLATQAGTDTDFVHSPLNCNQTRHYQIKGISNNPTLFTFSDTLQLTPFDTVPPVAPTILGASVVANGSIQLDWLPVGGEVRSYEIWMKSSGSPNFTTLGVVGAISSFQVTGLNTLDSAYCFYLIALDTCASNRSLPSIVHCVSQLQGVAQNLQNTLNWNVYSGSIPAKTKVQIFQGGWNDLDSLPGLASNYVHDSLPCRVPVTYRLKMEFPNGYLSYSDSITLTPFDTIPPAQPTILRASVLSNSSVQITWALGNADIGNYEIWVKSANQANFTLAQTVGAVTSGIVTGLNTTDSSYCFRLVALDTCSNNRSPFSIDECAIQLQGFEQNLQTTLSWSAYSTFSGIAKYYIQTRNAGSWTTIDSTSSTSFIHRNVPCLTAIHYRIMAVYPVADTSFSDTLVLVPFDTIKPVSTLLTSASVQENGSITVRWNPSASPDVRFHDVYRAPMGSTAFVLVGTATDVDTFNDATVTNVGSQRYTYNVVAIDSCNMNNRSTESNAHTTFDLSVSSGACQPAVTLKWTSYPSFTNGLLRYRVWRSAGGPWTLVDSVAASDTDFIDYTVNPRFSYCYQVEAVSNGQSYLATSDTSCQVPRLFPNPNPTTMFGITTTTTGVANGQTKITWNRFPVTDSLARGYVIYHSTSGVWPYAPIATISRPNDTVFFHNNINTQDSTHYYTVKVIDTCGAQSDSAAPFRTINLNLTIGNGAMVLDWLPVLNDTVNGYEIERSSNGLPLVPITILTPSTTQFIDSAVSCGTRYSYRVKGLYSLKPNFTTFSDSVSGIARDTIPPDVSIVEMASVLVPNRNGQIELSFYSPTQQNRSGYNIYRKSGNGAWSLLRTFNTTAFGLINTTDFGVNTLDSTYQYRITSLDSCGNESQFGEVHSPSNISVTAVSQANNISWTAYQGFDSLIYRLERSINGGNFQFYYDLTGTSYTDSSVKCDTQYTYRVKVYDIQNPTVISLSDTATVIGIDLTVPATPVLGVVSVTNTNPFGGTVQVNFAASTSTDVRYHILERRTANSSNWSVRARIPAGGSTVFNDFGNTSDSIYVYRVYAIDTCGNVSPYSTEHAFVHLETTPLNESMQLNWSRYVGFPVGKYDVVRDGIVIASFLGGNDTSMIDTQLICTQTYQYFIRTYGLDQLTTSLSNVENNSPFDTTAPLNTYLQVATVERGDAANKITFRASTSFDVRTYQIWRRTNGAGAPVVVYQTNSPVIGFTTIVDSLNVKADAEFYCYSIVAFDYCGNQSPESNLGCTMLAKATYSNLKSTITWTPYSQWWTGVDHYEVERTTDGTNWIQVANVAPNVNKFIDEDLPADAGQLCYRVMAVEAAGNFNEKSYSNTACVVPEPVVHIPTAFSPGTSAGLNDNFGPVAAFYDQFELTIFNRWGEMVFEGKSKNERWDGKHKGELVQTGVYVYQLIVYDFNGKPYRFQGTLSVVR